MTQINALEFIEVLGKNVFIRQLDVQDNQFHIKQLMEIHNLLKRNNQGYEQNLIPKYRFDRFILKKVDFNREIKNVKEEIREGKERLVGLNRQCLIKHSAVRTEPKIM